MKTVCTSNSLKNIIVGSVFKQAMLCLAGIDRTIVGGAARSLITGCDVNDVDIAVRVDDVSTDTIGQLVMAGFSITTNHEYSSSARTSEHVLFVAQKGVVDIIFLCSDVDTYISCFDTPINMGKVCQGGLSNEFKVEYCGNGCQLFFDSKDDARDNRMKAIYLDHMQALDEWCGFGALPKYPWP